MASISSTAPGPSGQSETTRGTAKRRGKPNRQAPQGKSNTDRHSAHRSSGKGRSSQNAPARPTHFLSLPLTAHANLHKTIDSFQRRLLAGSIPGVDASILIAPIRMHFTLGVMNLVQSPSPPDSGQKTIQDALNLLTSLRPQVLELLSSSHSKELAKLRIPLTRLGHFGSKTSATVLWIGPPHLGESPPDVEVDIQRLKTVSNFVNNKFKENGFITDKRPLELHCTLMKTSARRPAKDRKIGFSFDGVLSCTEAMSVLRATANTSADAGSHTSSSVAIQAGTYIVDEIQLCRMGSKGPRGEYVSLGGISLLGT